ncbi:sugar phosphate nucleotidyltransferase [Thalassotalea fusca]
MDTIVILAAGNGSRFGGPKQFTRFGPLQLTLMQYNLRHAIEAGFTKAVIIVQHNHRTLLTPIINQLSEHIEIEVCYQESKNLPETCCMPRQSKPLGTAQALWCARQHLSGDFAVINADDYYGCNAFNLARSIDSKQAALIAYQLQNTLSASGGVNRGHCVLNSQSELDSIAEIIDIQATDRGIVGTTAKDRKTILLEATSLVSMNFWVLPNAIFEDIESLLITTLAKPNPHSVEVFLPDVIAHYILRREASVKVLTSLEPWFGVTYEADATYVNQCLTTLTRENRFTHFHVNPS